MTTILLLLGCLQDMVEMKDHESFYLLHTPKLYDETKSWPVVVQLEGRGGKASDGIERWRDRGFIVVAPEQKAMGREREAGFVRTCLEDAKSRLRIDPERVLLSGRDLGADAAAALAVAEPSLFAGCAAFGLTVAPEPKGKAPPFHVVLRPSGEPARRGREAASTLANAGVDVLARTGFDPRAEDEGAALDWFGTKAMPKGDLGAVDRFIESRRWLDASLVSLGLLDGADVERFVRLRLRRIEAEGIVVLGSVEVAMAERKYLDAWIRCRDASVQFSWVPVGERIRKRLRDLGADPRVKRARGEED
jgi:predicted esterase